MDGQLHMLLDLPIYVAKSMLPGQWHHSHCCLARKADQQLDGTGQAGVVGNTPN